jgi:dihydroorotate dehydrogenase
MNLMDMASHSLRLLKPEAAHNMTLAFLKLRNGSTVPVEEPRLKTALMGLSFPNPVGLAAGFDKNGAVPDALLRLGFGFVEVGTVTPKAQAGNPKPRIFRLAKDQAVINRLGFNNSGHAAMVAHLESRRGRRGLIGINIGANKDSEDRVGDYVAGVYRFAPMANYLTVNISSPNTPGLRNLQEGDLLHDLLKQTLEARDKVAESGQVPKPVLVKIAPDLSDSGLQKITAAAIRFGADGLIISNTTLRRDGLRSRRNLKQVGGLSGKPLFERSTAMLARARQLVGPEFPLVGVGGIDSPDTAWSKIAAGANLVQIYTGLVYQGPSLINRIKAGLIHKLDQRNFENISQARNIETERWAALWPSD